MDRDFSFADAVQGAFEFMVNDAKTFFAPVVCFVILTWLTGFTISFLLTAFGIYMYPVALLLTRIVLTSAAILVFAAVFFQKANGKQLSELSQDSIVNLLMFAAAVYILPAILLCGLPVLLFILYDFRNISAVYVIAVSLVILVFSFLYFIFFVLSVLSPYFYMSGKSFTQGIQESIKAVTYVIIKMLLIVFIFSVILSIISALPMAAGLLAGFAEKFAYIFPITGILSTIILFSFMAFFAAVLTQIYLQLQGKIHTVSCDESSKM